MSAPPPVTPRKLSVVRVMLSPDDPSLPSVLPLYTAPVKESVTIATNNNGQSSVNAEREVEILNHCFDDMERFMLRLQQTAEAQSVLNQRKKKKRKSKKKMDNEDDLLSMKACPPTEEEFVNIYQKFKYSFSLLDRLKSTISEPGAPELLHHVFGALKLMEKTTGAELGASVVSPALTSGAVSLLQDQLTAEERELWTSLGHNWTSARSHLGVSVPPYSPVFLDGWTPQGFDSGQAVEDPIESQHKEDELTERLEVQRAKAPGPQTDGSESTETHGNGLPDGERLFCCSYDFVARNSSELSVLQGETLEVIESSKRWWKCRNRFDQIGFVPHNILEPLSELNKTEHYVNVMRRETKTALVPRSKYYSYAPTSAVESSPTSENPPVRPHSMVLPTPLSMQGDDNSRVLIMNDELLERLAGRRGSLRPPVMSKAPDTSSALDFHSEAPDVKAWLAAKGFSEQTIASLGILNGAQLFSLNKEELCTVSPQEGARVYSQIMVQRALLEDVCKASELEAAMEKQKLKSGTADDSQV
ncbi:epidermal growth factor receptor kinase substrate 8-like protein 1 [Eucyclogobius newberryi]|uniref:epidermal growth factor receptor kinase substrate 8-like protein 1 n=1 Tax=Eucyclogobius newberryi TaxID=166745 RepID=UPI003B5943EE